jgi:putative transposase
MRQSQHTESEILHLLVEANAGLPITELCEAARISPRTYYRWRARYGGFTPTAVREVKDLQLENRRLRSLVTSLSTRTVAETLKTGGVGRPSLLRHDYGCERADTPGANNSGGASLGRFAFVRGRR